MVTLTSSVQVPLCHLETLDRLKDGLEVALLVLEYRRRQFLLDERDVVEDDGVGGRHVARLQQRLLALAQLRALVVGTRDVHQHLGVVVFEELLHTVLILTHTCSAVHSTISPSHCPLPAVSNYYYHYYYHVHQHLGVVVLEELLHTVLILTHTQCSILHHLTISLSTYSFQL